MQGFVLTQLSDVSMKLLSGLMTEEVEVWQSELNWDYSNLRRVLSSLIEQRALSGYVALAGDRALAYCYFLIQQTRGNIGSVFGSKDGCAQEMLDEVLEEAIDSLQGHRTIRRIEAQVMPFNSLDPSNVFENKGFHRSTRLYLALDLSRALLSVAEQPSGITFTRWYHWYEPRVAEVLAQGYGDAVDAMISEDYRSLEGCQNYLRILQENPGCGPLLDEASFLALNPVGKPCGVVLCSRISAGCAMIPQVAIVPEYQGRGLGRALMQRALRSLRNSGFRSVALTVTEANRRACEWYLRLGFEVRKGFGAYYWQR